MAVEINVRREGIIGDGRSLNTVRLQSLIDRCSKQGGGCLYFPPGTYLTGTLNLCNHLRIHLDKDAVLKASPDRADFPPFGMTCERRDTALLLAIDAHDISIEGSGTIDGNHDAYFAMDEPGEELDYDPSLVRQGSSFAEKPNGIEDGPARALLDPEGRELRYGTMFLFIRCTDLSFRNFRISGSPNWCLHLAACERATLSGLSIRNSLLVPNADCIDVANSNHVTITNCFLEGGDDGIAISPCADGYGLNPTENIVVKDCTIISRSCAIRVGYGIERVSDCVFENISIRKSNRGIGIFVRNQQVIENITFTNINIDTRLHSGWWGAAEPIHISVVPGYTEDRKLGCIKNVCFRNISARSENGILLYGGDDLDQPFPIQQIVFEHMRLEILAGPRHDRFGGNIDLRPAENTTEKVFASDLSGITARNVKGFKIMDFELIWPEAEETPSFFKHAVDFQNCEKVEFRELNGEAPPSYPENEAIRIDESRSAEEKIGSITSQRKDD